MDFTYTEEETAVEELAGRIFSDLCTLERMSDLERAAGDAGPFDSQLWSRLAETGLVGIGLREDVGGGGMDFIALALVIEAAGRHGAYVPVVETMAYGAGVIDAFGTKEQRERWLPGVCSGDEIVTMATPELVDGLIVEGFVPTTRARRVREGGWVVDGTKACVPAGLIATLILVPATVEDTENGTVSTEIFAIDPASPGVRVVRQDTTAGRPEAIVELDGVRVDDSSQIGEGASDQSAESGKGAAKEILPWVIERATTALCVQQAGACAAALSLVSEYTTNRHQFGKPIATFQAVGQRAADAYVDTQAIKLTAWQAAWRIARGLSCSREVAIAKYWAAEGGQRVVHAAVHLHGGVGVDRDYPLHRYFLLTHQIELTLGGATESLRRLGSILAS